MLQSGHCSLYLAAEKSPQGRSRSHQCETAPNACALFVNSLVVSLWQSGSAQRIRIPVG